MHRLSVSIGDVLARQGPVEFWVSGRAAPQGSKTFKGIHNGRGVMVESSSQVGPWRERVALVAHNAMIGRKLLAGAIGIRLDFVLPRPKATPRRSTPPAIKRPDLDKSARAILDAITGIIVIDDAQVTDLHATKRLAALGEPPGVKVLVFDIDVG